jgi:hypothetical protein
MQVKLAYNFLLSFYFIFEMKLPCGPLYTFKNMCLPPLLITPHRATQLECSNTFVLSRVK